MTNSCEIGEIGRHKGFKIPQTNNLCQFKSGISHHLYLRVNLMTFEKLLEIHEDNLSLGYKMIIRYPADLPVFNEKDSSCIEKIISIIESNNLDDVSCKDLNRLKLIKEKINHSLDFTRV